MKNSNTNKLYWYAVLDDFYCLDDMSDVVEIRRSGFDVDSNGTIVGTGDLYIIVKSRADEYYAEQGLKYIGYENIDD